MSTSRKLTTKAAAKKAAKKLPTKRVGKGVDLSASLGVDAPFVSPVVLTSSIDLFSDDEDHSAELVVSMREGLDGISQRAKTKQVSFLTPEQMRKTIIPLDEITLQNAIGAVGLRSASLFELIAPEHVGKTTLIFNWLGKFGLQGCQALYVECEGKQMDPNRVVRCLHTDRKVAARLFKLITFTKARTLMQAEHSANVWAAEARARSDANPKFAGKPLIVVLDPWGKLMSEAQAAGRSDWGMNPQAAAAAKAKIKETGKASNLGHSNYAHAWSRELPLWLEQYNVLLIIVQHQNEHIDMGSYSPVTVSDAKNDTAIGGNAFKQLAAYRATLTNAGQWQGSNKLTVGLKTRLMFIKNSYGPKFRTLDLRLKFEHHADTPTHFDPVTYYSHGLADWMATNGILNTKLSDKLYTCDTLKCVAVTADELHSALRQRPDVIQFIGAKLKIEGYAHVPMTVQPIKDNTPDPTPYAQELPPPAPQELPPEVLQALADTAHLATSAGAVRYTMPPPPGDDVCMTTPEDMRPGAPEPSIGGPSSMDEAFAGAPPE